MSKIDDGGPAFPSEGEGHGNPKYHSPGMTFHDWLVGQALAGYIANPGMEGVAAFVVRDCFAIADAIITERAKRRLS